MATKSSIVSGMGLATSIIVGLVKAVKKWGGTDEDVHRLATPEGEVLLDEIGRIVAEKGLQLKGRLFKVIVDLKRDVLWDEETDTFSGIFKDFVREDSTECFNLIFLSSREWKQVPMGYPFNVKKNVTIVLLPGDDFLPGDVSHVTSVMKKRGWRPANLAEILALGKMHAASLAGKTILACGSAWTPTDEKGPITNQLVPLLDVTECCETRISVVEEPLLDGYVLEEDYWFAAVRE